MNDIAKAEIDSFVNENHGKMTARGMARQLQIGEGVVRKAMKRLGLTFTRADVHNMPANRRAAKKRIAASREKLNEGRRKSLKDKAAKKKGELQQLKAKMTGYELKTCKVCHVQWPLADQFFPERKRVRVGKDGLAVDTTYFENTCRVLQAESSIARRRLLCFKEGGESHIPFHNFSWRSHSVQLVIATVEDGVSVMRICRLCVTRGYPARRGYIANKLQRFKSPQVPSVAVSL